MEKWFELVQRMKVTADLLQENFQGLSKNLAILYNSKTLKFTILLEHVKLDLNLHKLNYDHYKFSQYEPEIGFPGLIYRMHQPKIVLLIFVSGKIVLTGAKSI